MKKKYNENFHNKTLGYQYFKKQKKKQWIQVFWGFFLVLLEYSIFEC